MTQSIKPTNIKQAYMMKAMKVEAEPNKVSALVDYFSWLYGPQNPNWNGYQTNGQPTYGWMGRVMKQVGGHKKVVKMLWACVSRDIDGDPLAYIMGEHKRWKGTLEAERIKDEERASAAVDLLSEQSYLMQPIPDEVFMFSSEQGARYIDWNVMSKGRDMFFDVWKVAPEPQSNIILFAGGKSQLVYKVWNKYDGAIPPTAEEIKLTTSESEIDITESDVYREWDNISSTIKETCRPAFYNLIFSKVNLLGSDSKCITVGVPDTFIKEQLKHEIRVVKNALRKLGFGHLRFDIEVQTMEKKDGKWTV